MSKMLSSLLLIALDVVNDVPVLPVQWLNLYAKYGVISDKAMGYTQDPYFEIWWKAIFLLAACLLVYVTYMQINALI